MLEGSRVLEGFPNTLERFLASLKPLSLNPKSETLNPKSSFRIMTGLSGSVLLGVGGCKYSWAYPGFRVWCHRLYLPRK